MRRCADIQFEHSPSSLDVWKGNVYTFLESYGVSICPRNVNAISPPLDGWIQLPWDVCCAQYQDTRIIISNTIYLMLATVCDYCSPAPETPF